MSVPVLSYTPAAGSIGDMGLFKRAFSVSVARALRLLREGSPHEALLGVDAALRPSRRRSDAGCRDWADGSAANARHACLPGRCERLAGHQLSDSAGGARRFSLV